MAALTIRPFFGYYGGKWRDAVKNYPPPKFGTIVEPFAGSAGYSLRYPDRKVFLYEIDPILCAVWDYLIRVKAEEILAIPNVPLDGSVDDLHICEEARWLVGFWLNRGVATPRKKPSIWMRSGIRPGSFWGDRVRKTIANQVIHIRHWKIIHRSYKKCAQHGEATWFIDPPYQNDAGTHYRYGPEGVDYDHLAEWCQARQGQVIVCENEGARWLPFGKPIASVKTTRRKRLSKEVRWVQLTKTKQDPQQRAVARTGT